MSRPRPNTVRIQALLLLRPKSTITTAQTYLLLLRYKPPTITTRPTTITFQPYYYYDTNLLLLRPKYITVSLQIYSKYGNEIFGRWIRWEQITSVISAHPMEGCYKTLSTKCYKNACSKNTNYSKIISSASIIGLILHNGTITVNITRVN